jgi:uncharacterized phiE125 gp8 family phage protein
MQEIGELSVKTATLAETITAAEIRSHAKEDLNTEDTLLGYYATTVRQLAEIFTRRAFVETVFEYRLDRWPATNRKLGRSVIELPRREVTAVAHVKYIAPSGDHSSYTTLPTTEYVVDMNSSFCRIMPDVGYVFPTLRDTFSTVLIEFTAGYGSDASTVPEGIKTALKYAATWFYENRVPPESAALPEFVKSMLRPYAH